MARYTEMQETFLALVIDLEAASNDLQQGGFTFNRLFWAGLFFAIVS